MHRVSINLGHSKWGINTLVLRKPHPQKMDEQLLRKCSGKCFRKDET